jgi:hypothetical protein
MLRVGGLILRAWLARTLWENDAASGRLRMTLPRDARRSRMRLSAYIIVCMCSGRGAGVVRMVDSELSRFGCAGNVYILLEVRCSEQPRPVQPYLNPITGRRRGESHGTIHRPGGKLFCCSPNIAREAINPRQDFLKVVFDFSSSSSVIVTKSAGPDGHRIYSCK